MKWIWIILIAVVVLFFIGGNFNFLGSTHEWEGQTCTSSEPTTLEGFNVGTLNTILVEGVGAEANKLILLEGTTATSECKAVCEEEGDNTRICVESKMLVVCDGGNMEGDIDYPTLKNIVLTSNELVERTYKGVTYYVNPSAGINDDPNGIYFVEQGTELWIQFSAQVKDGIIEKYIDTFYTCTTPTTTTTIPPECTIDADCPQNVCGGMTCVEGQCMPPLIVQWTKTCPLGEPKWLDYPDCKWKCEYSINPCTWGEKIYPENGCLVGWAVVAIILGLIAFSMGKKK